MTMIQIDPTVRAGAVAVLVRSAEIYSVKQDKPITSFIDNLRDKKIDPQMRDALTQAMLERQIIETKTKNVTKAAREVSQLTNNLENAFQSIHSYEIAMVGDLFVNLVKISEETAKLWR